MKAIAPFTLSLFWLICIVVILSMGEVGLRLGGGKAYELPVRVDIYSMQNALDAGKTYLDTGLRYSAYQACYDMLKNGGWREIPAEARFANGTAYWGRGETPHQADDVCEIYAGGCQCTDKANPKTCFSMTQNEYVIYAPEGSVGQELMGKDTTGLHVSADLDDETRAALVQKFSATEGGKKCSQVQIARIVDAAGRKGGIIYSANKLDGSVIRHERMHKELDSLSGEDRNAMDAVALKVMAETEYGQFMKTFMAQAGYTEEHLGEEFWTYLGQLMCMGSECKDAFPRPDEALAGMLSEIAENDAANWEMTNDEVAQYLEYYARAYDIFLSIYARAEAKPCGSAYPSAEKFQQGLKSSILNNLNAYAAMGYSFFSDYDVKLPLYGKLDMEPGDNSLGLKASSGGVLRIEKTVPEVQKGQESGKSLAESVTDPASSPSIKETVKLDKASGLATSIDTPCYGIYQQGVSKMEDIMARISQQLKDEVDGLLAGVVSDSCTSLVADAEASVREALGALDGAEVAGISLRLSNTGYDEQTKTCLFQETGESSATVKVTVNGPADKTFPVMNRSKGDVYFEPLSLVFAVQSTYKSS